MSRGAGIAVWSGLRRIGGVAAAATLSAAISLANRGPHHGVVHFCCAYTPARLAAGDWWTVLGSALLVAQLRFFGVNAAVLVGVVLPYALRHGSRRALATFFTGHVVPTLAVAAVVLPLAAAGWPAAEAVRRQPDVGISAGIAAIAGAAAVSMRRRRYGAVLFGALAAFFGVHLLFDRTLSELEHLIALTVGALLARSVPPARATG